jgi:acyl carrier protein
MNDFLPCTRQVLCQVFNIPSAPIYARIDSLGTWDSHRFLYLVLALEEEFDMEFEPEDTDEMTTVAGLAKIIEMRCKLKTL